MPERPHTHELRHLLLPWVQDHFIQRYSDKTVVSHNDGVVELTDLILGFFEPRLQLGDLLRDNLEKVLYAIPSTGQPRAFRWSEGGVQVAESFDGPWQTLELEKASWEEHARADDGRG